MSGSELRIGDKERETAVNALGEHYAAGRLTKEEYDERAAVAYAAKTESSLRPLFADLPGPHPFAVTSRPTGRQRPPSGSGQWAGWTPGAPGAPMAGPGAPGVRQRGFRLPVMPFLLVLLGVVILTKAPWLLFIGLGILLFAKMNRHHRRYAQQHGWQHHGWHGGYGPGSR